MFEKAIFNKYRFSTPKGNLTTEDVCDLPLTSKSGCSLDDLARSLNKQIRELKEESFVTVRSTSTTELETKLEIVKRVIQVRLEAIEKRRNMAKNKEKKERYLRLIADKENDAAAGLSIEELRKLVDEIEVE